MGTVWAAADERTGQDVALKLIRTDLADDADAPERFRREALASSRVQHPNIVPLLESGILPEGLPFLVYELVHGPSLKEELAQRGRLSAVQSVSIAMDVLGGLGAAHASGIVHRDVKPSNVLLEPSTDAQAGRARMIDFGVAKSLTGTDGLPRVTSTGEIVGTAQYMSPEQAGGKGDVDAQSDLWSVGVMLYEMLSGHSPFEARSTTQTILKILSQEAPPLASVCTGAPDALFSCVHRALQRDRAQRWPSAIVFAEVLSRSIDTEHQGGRTTMVGFRDPTHMPDETATLRRAGERDDE